MDPGPSPPPADPTSPTPTPADSTSPAPRAQSPRARHTDLPDPPRTPSPVPPDIASLTVSPTLDLQQQAPSSSPPRQTYTPIDPSTYDSHRNYETFTLHPSSTYCRHAPFLSNILSASYPPAIRIKKLVFADAYGLKPSDVSTIQSAGESVRGGIEVIIAYDASRIGSEDVRRLSGSCRNLTVLCLEGARGVDDGGFEGVIRGCAGLVYVRITGDVNGVGRVSDGGLVLLLPRKTEEGGGEGGGAGEARGEERSKGGGEEERGEEAEQLVPNLRELVLYDQEISDEMVTRLTSERGGLAVHTSTPADGGSLFIWFGGKVVKYIPGGSSSGEEEGEEGEGEEVDPMLKEGDIEWKVE